MPASKLADELGLDEDRLEQAMQHTRKECVKGIEKVQLQPHKWASCKASPMDFRTPKEHYFRCPKCSRTAKGDTREMAIIQWNEDFGAPNAGG